MTRLIKLKYIVIIMLAIALITSITAFSVSYAIWTGKTSDNLAVSGSTGSWDKSDVRDVNSLDDAAAVKILKEKLTEDNVAIPEKEPQTGGIIGINDPSVTAAVWQNTGGADGYTTPSLYMTKGTTFIICVFNRIIDPTNKDKNKGEDGYAILKTGECNGFDYLDYHTPGDGTTDNTRYVFTAKEDGWYTITAKEGDRNWSFGYPDDYKKHDLVWITYSETQPA